MTLMDDVDFGKSIRILCRGMQKELVGSTAVRKSSKIKDIIDEFVKRMPQIEDKNDLVNYTYFLAKLYDFDLLPRVPVENRL
jgi:hypothetical protein